MPSMFCPSMMSVFAILAGRGKAVGCESHSVGIDSRRAKSLVGGLAKREDQRAIGTPFVG